MFTKKQRINKYCCLYVSDFHLEMILLPYLKKKINNSKILIFTQTNLTESIKILLDKTNFNIEDKEKILNINCWNNVNKNELYEEKGYEYTIIINGDIEYIMDINEKIKTINSEIINVVDCYNINNINIKSQYINENYKGTLNTKSFNF